jgi:malate dehydrogenase (oxaloacetate-decarboxylating)(NADP+)
VCSLEGVRAEPSDRRTEPPAAAEAISDAVTDAELAAGALLPPLADLRAVAARVACAAARRHYELGVATELPRPPDLGAHLRKSAYEPSYRKYR